jgi:hypothetical protein
MYRGDLNPRTTPYDSQKSSASSLSERHTNVSKHASQKNSRTNWDLVDAASDDDLDYTDIPEQTEDFFNNAVLRMPKSKAIDTPSLDSDILTGLRIARSPSED